MAEADPVQSLLEEATCSVCLEYFTDPVSTECGHNFCRACLAQCWDGPGEDFPCPQCRLMSSPGSLKPNRQLKNIVRITQQLTLRTLRAGEEGRCERHDEKLKIFCQDEQKPICVVCSVSVEHRSHTVVPIEEAAEEFKVKLKKWMHPLKKEIQELLEQKSREEIRFKALSSELKSERLRITTESERLRQLLNRLESALLSQLEAMDKKVTSAEHAKMATLSGRISALGSLIEEIEEKCKQAAGDFMKDVKITMNKCENVKFQKPEEKMKSYKEHVNLDQVTAHPCLVLSKDKRSVEYGGKTTTLPEDPRRFDFFPCVLGSEGFTSGRHYWEVEVRGGGGWYVGAVKESVKRKGAVTVLPTEGFLAIWGWKSEFKALTSPWTILSLNESPSKLGLYLDYEGGQLSLYNADTLEHLYTFTHAFTEKIYPFFLVTSKVELYLR